MKQGVAQTASNSSGNLDIFWKNKLGLILSLTIASLFVWSGIAPYNRGVWYVEIATAIVPLVLFFLVARRFPFSMLSYILLGWWVILQIIGAHYSFERVPFEWVTQTFGFARNHYDRLAHFSVGLSAYIAAEYVLGRHIVNTVKSAAFFGLIFIMALANAWELIEWAYAEIDGGEVGAAFLGSQGDIWDAQKDMLMDTLGALAAALLFCFAHRKDGQDKGA